MSDAFPNDSETEQPLDLNTLKCTPSGLNQNLSVEEKGGAGRTSDLVKAKSSGEDSGATGGLVSNLPHFHHIDFLARVMQYSFFLE